MKSCPIDFRKLQVCLVRKAEQWDRNCATKGFKGFLVQSPLVVNYAEFILLFLAFVIDIVAKVSKIAFQPGNLLLKKDDIEVGSDAFD